MRFLWQGILLFGLLIQSQVLASDDESDGHDKSSKKGLVFAEDRARQEALLDDKNKEGEGETGLVLNDDDSDEELPEPEVPVPFKGGMDLCYPVEGKRASIEDSPSGPSKAGGIEDGFHFDGPAPQQLMEALDLLLKPMYSTGSINCLRNYLNLRHLRNFLGVSIGVTGGALATAGFTGVIRKLTRDMLDAPQDTTLGNVVIGITVIALLPAFVGLLAEIGRKLPVSSKCCFSLSGSFLKAKQDFLFPTSSSHKALNALLFFGVGINSCITVLQMMYLQLENVPDEEKDQASKFVGGVGFFYFLADFVMNFNNGQREINHFFFNRFYPKTRETRTQRTEIDTRINFMKYLLKNASDKQIRDRYKTVMEPKCNQDLEPWKASWSIAEELKAEEALRFAKNREVLDGVSPPRRKIADFTAKVLIGLGTTGRFVTLFYGGNLISGWLNVDPEAASWVSGGFAGVGAIGRGFWESRLLHEFMRVLCCTETRISPDGRGVQTVTMGCSLASAALIALAGFSLGKKAFAGEESIYVQCLEAIVLSSAAVLNFSSYLVSSRKSTLFTIRPIGKGLSRLANKALPCAVKKVLFVSSEKRTALIRECEKLEAVVEQLTDPEMKKLYNWLRSVEAKTLKWTD